MSEKTATSKKSQFVELIKKYFNYPMLLFTIIAILNLNNIVGCFTSIFSCIFNAPRFIFSAIIAFVLSIAPVIFVLLLCLHRFQKMKNAKLFMGIFLVLITLLTIFKSLPTIISFFANISQYDAYTIFAESPFLNVLDTIFTLGIYSIAAVVLLCNKKVPLIYYIIIIIGIMTTLFFGIITELAISIGIMYSGGLIQAFITVLFYIAFWYVPKALNSDDSAEITKSKRGTLIVITVIVLGLYIVSSIASGVGFSTKEVPKSTCGSCGRTFKAGDSGGNYKSIAKSGLCNNCENNLEFFDWVLDK